MFRWFFLLKSQFTEFVNFYLLALIYVMTIYNNQNMFQILIKLISKYQENCLIDFQILSVLKR